LLGVVHLLFGLLLRDGSTSFRNVRTISIALTGAGVLLPSGFFLGGVSFYSGDPGIGVVLVPVGAVLLLAGLFLIASGLRTAPSLPRPSRPKGIAR
jgi:hypothetical protein